MLFVKLYDRRSFVVNLPIIKKGRGKIPAPALKA